MATSYLGHMARSFFGTVGHTLAEKNTLKYILIFLLIVLSSIGLYFGYHWYQEKRNQEAQFSFGVLLDKFNALETTQTEDFHTIADALNQEYTKYRRTSLAPYFLSLQADALIQAGDKQKALSVMNTLIASNNSTLPLFSLFKTKRALLALDSNDNQNTQQNLAELTALSHDTNNIYRDYALYHLGMYHWVHDDIEQARNAWNMLETIEQGDIYSKSPWATLAAQALQSLS